jgi:LPXTG-motif cell wall-anchored protein
MERIPPQVFLVAAVVFMALAVWSAADQNWSGLIVGLVLAGLCLFGLARRRRLT